MEFLIEKFASMHFDILRNFWGAIDPEKDEGLVQNLNMSWMGDFLEEQEVLDAINFLSDEN